MNIRLAVERAASITLLLISLGPASGIAVAMPRPAVIEQATTLIQAGDLRSALIQLRSAALEYPEEMDIRRLLATTALALGEAVSAEKEIDRAEALGLSEEIGFPLKIRAIYLQADPHRVIAATAEIPQSISPQDRAAVLGMRGQAFLQQFDFDQAKQTLDHALRVDPNCVDALVGHALLSLQLENTVDARRHVEHALEADAASPDAWTALGNIELATGNLEAANTAYTKSIELRPYADIAARASRALVQVRMQEYDAAAEDLQALRAIGLGEHPYFKFVQGRNDLAQGRYEEATMAFEASNAASPALLTTAYLAVAHLSMQHNEQARIYSDRILTALPSVLGAVASPEAINQTINDLDAAKATLRDIMEQPADSGSSSTPSDQKQDRSEIAQQLLVYFSLIDGNLSEALDDAERLVERNPGSQSARETLSLAMLLNGKPSEEPDLATLPALVAGEITGSESRLATARRDYRDKRYREAVEAARALHDEFPYAVAPLYLTAAAQMKLGDVPSAMVALEQILRIQPNAPVATRALATLTLLQGDKEKAHALLLSLVQTDPSQVAAIVELSRLEANMGEVQVALQRLERAVQEYPTELGIALETLVQLSLMNKDTGKAVAYAKSLVGRNPYSEQAQDALRWSKLLDAEPRAHEADAEASLSNLETSGASTAPEAAPSTEQRIATALLHLSNQEFEDALEIVDELRDAEPQNVEILKLASAINLAAGNIAAAENLLKRTLAIDPHEPTAVLNIATIEASRGNNQQAESLLRGLIEADPSQTSATLELARLLALEDDQDGATRVLEQAFKQNPSAEDVRVALTRAYFKQARYQELIELTDSLSDEQLAQHLDLLEYRGRAQNLSGDPASASQSFRLLAQRLPASARAAYYLADSLDRAGERQDAMEAMARAAEADPTFMPARIGEVRLLFTKGQDKRAVEALEALERDYGERPEVLGLAGWRALSIGDYENAEQDLRTAQQALPDTPLTLYLVQALWQQNKHDQALQVMSEWLRQYPRDLAVLSMQGNALLALERPADARSVLETIIQYYPDYVPALNDLAWISKADPELALSYAKRAYELAPDDPEVLDTLGVLLLEAGDVETAYQRLERAAELAPADPEIRLHLAQTLIKRGDINGARQLLAVLIDTGPDGLHFGEASALLESLTTDGAD